jgi:Glutaredoxin-like domain (DUF836)
MRSFALYVRERCSLCEHAVDLLQEANLLHLTDVVVIDDDDDLLARYLLRIPVFVATERSRERDWPFDAQALQDFTRNSP